MNGIGLIKCKGSEIAKSHTFLKVDTFGDHVLHPGHWIETPSNRVTVFIVLPMDDDTDGEQEVQYKPESTKDAQYPITWTLKRHIRCPGGSSLGLAERPLRFLMVQFVGPPAQKGTVVT